MSLDVCQKGVELCWEANAIGELQEVCEDPD